jgi:hypothetical protein
MMINEWVLPLFYEFFEEISDVNLRRMLEKLIFW